jgi:hypothetical protein
MGCHISTSLYMMHIDRDKRMNARPDIFNNFAISLITYLLLHQSRHHHQRVPFHLFAKRNCMTSYYCLCQWYDNPIRTVVPNKANNSTINCRDSNSSHPTPIPQLCTWTNNIRATLVSSPFQNFHQILVKNSKKFTSTSSL